MNWFVYIAIARTGRFYTGMTTNPEERLRAHNTGHGSRMAVQQGPFELVYVSNPYPTKSEARKREIQIKGWTVDKERKLILGECTKHVGSVASRMRTILMNLCNARRR